jgi:hypothetical protein
MFALEGMDPDLLKRKNQREKRQREISETGNWGETI